MKTPHPFYATRWSLVARATQGDAPAARAALDELCRLYWPPIFAFARRWGLSEADAEDATQNFFAELLRNDKFAVADPERGKLRTFLLHTFTKRLITFQQRSRQRGNISLDDSEAPLDLADPQTPEQAFSRQWAITTMDAALTRLEAEYTAAGKGETFSACRPLLSLQAGGNEDYAAIASQLGMKEGAVRVAAHRLRGRFRETLFSIVAETLDTASEANVRTEIGALIEALR